MTDEKDCTGCPLTDRRSFLRDAARVGLAMTVLPSLVKAMDLGDVAMRSTRATTTDGPLRKYNIPIADGVDIDHDADIILVRWQSQMYAFDLSCPHQNTALRWDDSAKHFRCPRHHSEYQPNGLFIKGRATRGMDRFVIRRDGEQIVVDTSAHIEQDRDPKGWEAAVLSVGAEK